MKRSGLLLVDVLNDFGHDDGERLLRSFLERGEALCALVAGARRENVPIVYANDNWGVWDGDAPRLVREACAGPGGDLVARLVPGPKDRFVVKPRYSAFDLTPLAILLSSLVVERIVLAGAATELCVLHTALAAEQRGFEVDLVPDACASVDPTSEGFALAYLDRAPGIGLLDHEAAISSFAGRRSREPSKSYLDRQERASASRNGSLGRVFDHVGIAVSDLAASERFYRTVLRVLGVEPSHANAELVEWDDWAIGPTDREHPVTRGLHVGFRAGDRAQVEAFWQAGIDAGYRDDGAPGPRTQYGPTYYGGFLLDPDGNSVEAVHGDRQEAVPAGRVDHLWFRVRDPEASRRFYTTIAPHAGLRLTHDEPQRVQLSGPDYSFSLVRDERPLTEHVHLAFPRARTARCARSTPPRSRRATGPRRAGRARGLPPGLLRRVRARPGRAQRRGRQPQLA